MLNKGHGIMFHHFYDDKEHINQQGAINKNDFLNILDYYSQKYKILDGREWLEKALNNKLEKNEVCLTFDDGLKCQYDIANNTLKEFSGGIYLIYTSTLTNHYSSLEIYRYFRNVVYNNIDDFYNEFFSILIDNEIYGKDIKEAIHKFNPKEYLKGYDFYTDNDRLFRYLRDNVIVEQYDYFMGKIMEKHNFSKDECIKKLWIGEKEIKDLHQQGNVIGLHSHNHPTDMSKFTKEQQYYEYLTNKKILEDIIGEKIVCMSHPCGAYNEDTIHILNNLGIKIGFRSNMIPKGNTNYEFLREDHINIFNKLKEKNI